MQGLSQSGPMLHFKPSLLLFSFIHVIAWPFTELLAIIWTHYTISHSHALLCCSLRCPSTSSLPDKLLFIFQYLAQISHSLLPYPAFSGSLSFLCLCWPYLEYTFTIALRILPLNANKSIGSWRNVFIPFLFLLPIVVTGTLLALHNCLQTLKWIE